MTVRILQGDCRAVLATLPSASVHCCVCSPPYFGLRSYLPDGHADKPMEIGAEQTPEAYVAALVAVFRDVRRVLRPDATCWIVLGDSYSNNAKWGGSSSGKHVSALHGNTNIGRGKVKTGLKPKDLIGIPWRVAFALQADGWFLRQDIIWSKPNPMPESVLDRCTKAHEYVFLLSKSPRYYYDAEAISEKGTGRDPGNRTHKHQDGTGIILGRRENPNGGLMATEAAETRTRRSVWTIATEPSSLGHFALMPSALAELCIKAGTSECGCCPTCGAPWMRETEPDLFPNESRPQGKRAMEIYRASALTEDHLRAIRACGVSDTGKALVTTDGAGRNAEAVQALAAEARAVLKGYYREFLIGSATKATGWSSSCRCPAHTPQPCTVIDPFGGAGTTAVVADRLGRDAILIELSPAYAAMARRRIEDDAGMFAHVVQAAE